MSYLDDIDLTMLRLAYPGIQKLHGEHSDFWKGGVRINEEFLKRHPVATCSSVYKAINDFGQSLTVEWIPDQDVVHLLPYMAKIDCLSLVIRGNSENLFDMSAIKKFPRLNVLSLIYNGHKDYHIHSLMIHLAPTLITLSFYLKSLTPLLHLHSLEYIRVLFSVEWQTLEQVLYQNRNLRHFAISFRTSYPDDDATSWSVLARATQLSTLRLESIHMEYPPIPGGLQFEFIDAFEFQLDSRTTMQQVSEILSHIGPQLKHLTIEGEVDILEAKKLSICGFKKLFKLFVVDEKKPVCREISGGERVRLLDDWRQVTMEWIAELPDLYQLKIPALKGDSGFLGELRCYLREKRRRMMFNGGEGGV